MTLANLTTELSDILQDPAALLVVLPKDAPAYLQALALACVRSRHERGQNTWIAGDKDVSSQLKFSHLWHKFADGFDPQATSNVIFLGVSGFVQSGFFEEEPNFADWPERQVVIMPEHDPFEYVGLIFQALMSLGISPAVATLLFAAFHLRERGRSFVSQNLEIYEELLSKGADHSLVFQWLNIPKPPALWWEILSKLDLAGTEPRAFLNKEELQRFGWDRVDILEFAQEIYQAKAFQGKLTENQQGFTLALLRPGS